MTLRAGAKTRSFQCDCCYGVTEPMTKHERVPDGWVRVQMKEIHPEDIREWRNLIYLCPECSEKMTVTVPDMLTLKVKYKQIYRA